jgi:hypothetical protein
MVQIQNVSGRLALLYTQAIFGGGKEINKEIE